MFGASEKRGEGYYAETHRATTWAELEEAMIEKGDAGEPKLKMVEVMMDKEDAPVTLLGLLDKQKEAAAVR